MKARDALHDHPVAAGVGSAAGAATGAVIGAAGGPVGMAVGAVIGAVAGGYAGMNAGEAFNPWPETEQEYWRSQYRHEAYYDPAMTYDDYDPAYRLGTVAQHAADGRAYDKSTETELEARWEGEKGISRLSWEAAKHPVRAAWFRAERAAEVTAI